MITSCLLTGVVFSSSYNYHYIFPLVDVISRAGRDEMQTVEGSHTGEWYDLYRIRYKTKLDMERQERELRRMRSSWLPPPYSPIDPCKVSLAYCNSIPVLLYQVKHEPAAAAYRHTHQALHKFI